MSVTQKITHHMVSFWICIFGKVSLSCHIGHRCIINSSMGTRMAYLTIGIVWTVFSFTGNGSAKLAPAADSSQKNYFNLKNWILYFSDLSFVWMENWLFSRFGITTKTKICMFSSSYYELKTRHMDTFQMWLCESNDILKLKWFHNCSHKLFISIVVKSIWLLVVNRLLIIAKHYHFYH